MGAGIFGAAIAILEGTLAQTFKRPMRGGYRGGPAYYMVAAMRPGRLGKIFGLCYSVVTVISLTFLMPEVQSYYIVQGLNEAFWRRPFACGDRSYGAFGACDPGRPEPHGPGHLPNLPRRWGLYMCSFPFLSSLRIFTACPGVFLILRSAWGRDAAFGGITAFALQWGSAAAYRPMK